MFRSLVKRSFASEKKIPKIDNIREFWDKFGYLYNRFDYAPQTFYYEFLYMSNIAAANNILEIACGTAKLLPLAIQMKQNQAKYLATDLSPQMINLSKANLMVNFQKYKSQLSFDQWLKQMNVSLKAMNGEEKIISQGEQKFDRIFCNMVLMLTENSQKMLRNLHECAAPGCVMGASIWGDPAKNKFINYVKQSILDAGFELPDVRSPFYLYKEIQKLVEKCGWQIMLNWQQNTAFPVMSPTDSIIDLVVAHQTSTLPEDQQQKVKQIFRQKVVQHLSSKKPLLFESQMLLLRKK